MKRNFYQTFEEVENNCFLHINFMNETYLLLDKYAHDIYENTNAPDPIAEKDTNLYEALANNGFIIDTDVDERAIVEMRRQREKYDSSMYHIVINPTLDCNLSCWYCYENKIKNSKISQDTVDGIKKNIVQHYSRQPYATLKISFFGGEPFICFDTIIEISSFADTFCKKHNAKLLIEFTTNGTLLTRSRIERLSAYQCIFQITLDGNRKQHNRTKHSTDKDTDMYTITLNSIRMIQEIIGNAIIFLRINFDKNTLLGFDDILADIDFLDRKRSKVILKRVWQVKKETIEKDLITEAINKLFNTNHMVDYYTQGKLCFAERINQLVVNYDGNVFKCTTINRFDEEHSFGKLNTKTGEIEWNLSKLAKLTNEMTPAKCHECRIFPICYGQCNIHLMNGQTECYLDSLNLSRKEYFMFMYLNSLYSSNIFSI